MTTEPVTTFTDLSVVISELVICVLMAHQGALEKVYTPPPLVFILNFFQVNQVTKNNLLLKLCLVTDLRLFLICLAHAIVKCPFYV